jgi:hypothetical protein
MIAATVGSSAGVRAGTAGRERSFSCSRRPVTMRCERLNSTASMRVTSPSADGSPPPVAAFPSSSRAQLAVECERRERPNRELGGVVFFKFLTTDYHFLPCLTNNNATRKLNCRWHLRGVIWPPTGRGTPMWPRTQLRQASEPEVPKLVESCRRQMIDQRAFPSPDRL